MVSVKYSSRIVTDSHFIRWLKDMHNSNADILRKLMFIKSSSMYHRKSHNVILDYSAKYVIENNILKPEPLGGAFKTVDTPYELKEIKCIYTKLIKYGILLTHDPPYKCYIFTSDAKISEYENNRHYNNVKALTVKSSMDAVAIINSFFQEFCSCRRKN